MAWRPASEIHLLHRKAKSTGYSVYPLFTLPFPILLGYLPTLISSGMGLGLVV